MGGGAATGIGRYLAEHPEVDTQLTGGPLAALGPADQVFRALALQERGDLSGAEAAWDAAFPRLYMPEYRACYAEVRDFLVARLEGRLLSVVDLASGRGDLASALLPALGGPLMLTNISPRVLRGNRRRMRAHGTDERVSLLALDARSTPFKTGVVDTLTTNFGLGNVHDAGRLLGELRRVVSGTSYAITYCTRSQDSLHILANS